MRTSVRAALGLVFAVTVTAWSAATFAQQPKAAPPVSNASAAAVSLAHQLLEIKKGKTLYEGSSAGIIDGMKAELFRANLTSQKDLNEVAEKLKEEFRGRENEIGNAMDLIYANSFTEDELKNLITFYKSPLGQKLLDQEPKTLQAFLGFTDAWNAKLAADVNARFREEMKKRGKPLL